MLCYTAFAASVTFNVNVPSSSVGIGDTFDITVEIAAGNQTISNYSYEVRYDSSLLKPVTGGTQNEEGILSYSGTGSSLTATFTFQTLASGTASIETSATEVLSSTGEAISMTPAYNSINISETATTESESSTEEALSANQPDEPDMVHSEDEVVPLTESSNIPDNTLVSVHSSGNTYYVLDKPAAVDVPSAFLPVKIKLNDTDVKAYMKGTDGNTVLLYAANTDGHQGWYYFNTQEGTFLDATDILESSGTDSLSSFMSKNKFIIMLIAIIVLVVLVVIIIILAVSLKGMITDYESQIDRLKKNIDKKEEANKGAKDNAKNESSKISESQQSAKEKSGAEHIRMSAPSNVIPTINNKALFPDEDTHESYADSDYDNQVSPDEDYYIHTDDYDESAFDDMDDAGQDTNKDSSMQEQAEGSNDMIDSAFAVTEDTDQERKIQASLDEIDAVLESAKKYKN